MSTYRHNYKAFGDEVLRAAFMVAEMAQRAAKVKARAEAIAPDATPFGEGYKFSFESSAGIGRRKDGKRTAIGTVSNTDPAGLIIEYGSHEGIDRKGRKHGATPAHRTLGKALDAAG